MTDSNSVAKLTKALQVIKFRHKIKEPDKHALLAKKKKSKNECQSDIIENREAFGEGENEFDFDDNLTYYEDSLSILRGCVDTPLGKGIPVWITTDSGSMTRLMSNTYAEKMKFKRVELRSQDQFCINGPGGGKDFITHMVKM